MSKPRRHSGYINITGGTEHVMLFKAAGIYLSPDDVIHHIDGNKGNNDPSNLRIMTRTEHLKLHAGTTGSPNSRARIPVTCPSCGMKRTIQYRTIRRANFTGLCKSCNGGKR